MKNSLPILLLKSLLILPNQEVKLELNNDLSKNVVLFSTENYHSELLVISPKDQMEEMPDVSDLPNVAVVCKVKSKIELPSGNLRVTLRGLFRATIKNLKNTKNEALICNYKKLEIPEYNEIEALATKKKLKEMLFSYVKNDSSISNSILNVIKDVEDLNKLTDVIAAFLPIPFLKKLEYIEQMNPVLRGQKLIEELKIEIEIQDLEAQLEEKIQTGLEENQKEFILKEKLRVIQEELGSQNEKEREVKNYNQQLEAGKFKNQVKNKLKNEIKKFEYTNEMSPELSNIRNYLDWMFSLPWKTTSPDEKHLKNIIKALDKSHYGMKNAKNKIIEYIAAKNRNPEIIAPIICFVGPAGVGKTSLAKSMALSLNKKFYKISVGGLNDSSVLNGHRRTYLGANPGKIMEALKRCGTNNPLILIDEVDKMVKDYKGDPASVLLDILDKNQNKCFIDHYIEEEFDLSKILFILTANHVENIPVELYDRLEIVYLNSYTVLEKIEIAKRYLLPEIYQNHLIESKNIKFSDALLKKIIIGYTKEAGVRELERVLTSIIRKLIVLGELENVKLTNEKIIALLGEEKYISESLGKSNVSGKVNALAVTNFGGRVLPIEAVFYEGNGALKITGMVEQMMTESIKVALSYLMANKDEYGISHTFFKKKDLHLHFLEASIKKEGPSAGVAITTAMISLIKNKAISPKYAMTGEITLQGEVKKIGGLKEKLVSALNENVEKVFIPLENHNDLTTIPIEIKNALEIIEVEDYKEIYQHLFKN